MPFQSEKQRRYLWANEPEIARDWADTYGSRIEKNDGGIMRVGFRVGAAATGGMKGTSDRGMSTGDMGGDSSADRGGEQHRQKAMTDVAKGLAMDRRDVRERAIKNYSTNPYTRRPTTTTQRDRGDWQRLQYLNSLKAQNIITGGTEDEEEDTPSAFQQSLTTGANTPNYYVGETPLASNLEWGKKMGVDPRTMGLTSFAAEGGRIPAAFGGIMDTATGRRGYFLGSIGKALGSVAKAAKKVFKSPVGKAAIMYGLGTYLGGTAAFGSTTGTPWYARWKDPKLLANLIKPSEWTGVLEKPGGFLSADSDWKNKLFMKYDKTKKAYDGLSLGKAAIYGSTLLPWMLPGPEEDDEGDKGSNYDVLRDKYASQLMNIKRGVRAGSLDPNEFSYLPADYTYTGAEGGRAGYYAGGQSIPSEYTMEDAMMTTTQDKLGGITDVMKQADQYRQGDIGQFYAAQGGRIGFAGGMNEKLAELKKAYNTYVKGGGTLSFEQFSTAFAEENFAEGGRIGAEEGGLMDLGGMEKDYRNDGGFVPLGGEEKADDVPARLSKNEFVFTADAVRGAGGGDIDKGAEIMENIMNNLEQGGQISEETQGLSGAQEMFDVSERLSEVV